MLNRLLVVSAALAVAFNLTGCVTERVVIDRRPEYRPVVSEGVIVQQGPPPLIVERVAVSPGPGYHWVPGHWVWSGRYVWNPGHWVLRPRPAAVWVHHHWERRGSGWVFVAGYWR